MVISVKIVMVPISEICGFSFRGQLEEVVTLTEKQKKLDLEVSSVLKNCCYLGVCIMLSLFKMKPQ